MTKFAKSNAIINSNRQCWPRQDTSAKKGQGQAYKNIQTLKPGINGLSDFYYRPDQLNRNMTKLSLEGIIIVDSDYRIITANPAGKRYLLTLSGAEIGDKLQNFGGLAIEYLLSESSAGLAQIELAHPNVPTCFLTVHSMLSKGGLKEWALVIKEKRAEIEPVSPVSQVAEPHLVESLAGGFADYMTGILAQIIGFAEILQGDIESPQAVKRNALQIISQSERAAVLVRQLLDFSHQSPLKKEKQNFATLVTTTLLEQKLPLNIRISLTVERGHYGVSVDPFVIKRALVSIIKNAQEAMPVGGEITVTLGHLSKALEMSNHRLAYHPTGWLMLSVADTGEGITPENIAHIFEPFFTTKRINQGSGLGLAQVYSIVDRHGGKVTVQSEVGAGSLFSIYLPVSA